LPLERWTLLVLRFRGLVLAAWLLMLAAGISLSVLLSSHLVTSYRVPGTGSDRAGAALARGFGERPDGTFTVVFRVRNSADRALQRRLRARLKRGAAGVPGGRVGPLRAASGVVYGDVETSLSLQRAKAYTPALRRALRAPSGPPALVTGQPAIQHDLDPQLAADLRRGETVALPLVLLVLAFVLGISLAVAIPFCFAACSIAGTLALLYATTQVVSVTSYATNVVGLIGLGLAVDYSLLVLCRYREELERGAPRELALVRTMAGAGRAVVFSALAVAIGLALLLVVPVPFVRTMGLAGLLIPVVSVGAALTLLPALLSFCGPRLFTRRRLLRRSTRPAREPWSALARGIMRHPVVVLVPAAALLLAAASASVLLRLTPGSLASLPVSTEATRGLAVLRSGFGPGALTPSEIVVDAGSAAAARALAVHAAVERLADRLLRDPEVSVVALGSKPPYVSADGRYARLVVIGRHEYGDPASRSLVARIRTRLVPAARFPAGADVLTGGAASQGVDFLARISAYLPWIVLLSLVAMCLVLTRAFRSLLLPIKAVFLNLLTVAATYGLLVLVFQRGIGAGPLGVHHSAEIEGWVPVFLFAAVFGLSMDYEVFLVSRMREEWDIRRDNVAAVAAGLERTGRVITTAALVMAVSFGGFVVGSVPGLQQFGLGLAIAVLIDATIVRTLLVPSLMAIFGRWNWWLPPGPAQLRPTPSPRLEEAGNEA
jgi:RND superfamily putative drug exporter